jgi:hypothetical protein
VCCVNRERSSATDRSPVQTVSKLEQNVFRVLQLFHGGGRESLLSKILPLDYEDTSIYSGRMASSLKTTKMLLGTTLKQIICQVACKVVCSMLQGTTRQTRECFLPTIKIRVMLKSTMLLIVCHLTFVDLNSTLWENLRDEIQDPKEALQTSSDDETNDTTFPEAAIFYLSRGTATKDLSSLHPSPVHIFRLWQTFLVNVNPLVKIFHAPTVQQIILDATGDLSHIPRATESLMFAIYLISVTSLKSEECETMFGESRAILISKYSQASQQALINGKFLKSVNLYSLQAFCLYLVSGRLSLVSPSKNALLSLFRHSNVFRTIEPSNLHPHILSMS